MLLFLAVSWGGGIGEWGDRRVQSRPPSITSVESVVANSRRTYLDGVCVRPLPVGRGPSLLSVPGNQPFNRNQLSALFSEATIVDDGECQFGHRQFEGFYYE